MIDWTYKAQWKISDLEGNSLTVNTDLELAYFKARSLLYAGTEFRESPRKSTRSCLRTEA